MDCSKPFTILKKLQCVGKKTLKNLLLTATAMCSSGFETQNFKYRTNNDSRTNVKERTETAIAYNRC